MMLSQALQVAVVQIVLGHAKIHVLALVPEVVREVEEVVTLAMAIALVHVKEVQELVAIALVDAQEGVMVNALNHVIPAAKIRVKVVVAHARIPANIHVQHTVNIILESKNEQNITRKIKTMGGRAF